MKCSITQLKFMCCSEVKFNVICKVWSNFSNFFFFVYVLGTFTLYSFNEQSTIYQQLSLYFIFKATFYFYLQRTQYLYYLCKGNLFIRRGIKPIVIIIGAYHFCQPLTKFYPTSCSQG